MSVYNFKNYKKTKHFVYLPFQKKEKMVKKARGLIFGKEKYLVM